MSRVNRTKKKVKRPYKRKRQKTPLVTLRKILWILLLTSVLFFSLGSLGYVIFFRTVYAAEIRLQDNVIIVFEEPDPPLQENREFKLGENLASTPRIAIIIDDMGFHRKVGEELLSLPLNLTFSFLPGAPYTATLEEHAHRIGRTILLHLPLEPRGQKWNPGPGALYLGEMDLQKATFEENLAYVPHAKGVNNHMGSLYSEDEDHMAGLIQIIKDKNLFYIDSFTTAESVGLRLAQKMGVKTARRHIFLDNLQAKEKICEQLEKLVIRAEEQGWAIGIGHPYPQTFKALKECQPGYATRAVLVGAHELVN